VAPLSPTVRRLALTAHVGTSVGWLGAVAAFLALSIVGLTRGDAESVRGAYVSMNAIGEMVIVPLSLASLGTGVIQGIITPWGLTRHYWVLTKLALTIAATVLLLMHQLTAVAGAARRVAASTAGSLPDVGGLGTQLVVDAAAAVVVLIVTTVLSIYKPWGRTSWARDNVVAAADSRPTVEPMPRGLRVFLIAIGLIIGTIAVVHLAGGGMSHRRAAVGISPTPSTRLPDTLTACAG
jgi:hypothetical protein